MSLFRILTEETHQGKDSIPISLNISQDQILIEECQQSDESLTQLNKQENVYGGIIYDRELLEKPLDNSLFLKRIRPEVRQQFLGEHRKYKFLKKFAVECLAETLRRQLNIFSNLNHCYGKNGQPDAEITHEIFSWSLEEFQKRRLLDNFVWIDVMLKYDELCMGKFKFRKDLEEFQTCVDSIFQALLSNIDDKATIDEIAHVMLNIRNIKKVLHFCNNMEQELEHNERELNALDKIDILISQVKRDSDKRLTAILLQQRINNNHICTPIEMRCQFSWYRTCVNQRQLFVDIVEENYSNDIIIQKNKIELERAYDNNCMDYFYTTIDNLKSTINNVQSEFDEVAEARENILNIKRARLDKLRDKRKFLSNEIKRFQAEIEVKRIKEEAEAAEIENLRLQEEEKALAANLIEEQRKNNKKGNKKAKKL